MENIQEQTIIHSSGFETKFNLKRFFQNFIGKEKKFLVLDFGESCVEIIYAQVKSGTFYLLAWDTHILSETDSSKEASIIGFVNGFISEYSIAERDAVISISKENVVFVKHMTLPHMPDAEIFGAVKWLQKDEVPFDANTATIDWQIIKEYLDNEGAKKKDLVVAFLEKQTVDHYLALTSLCELTPISITSRFFSYANILRSSSDSHQTAAVLDIDQFSSSLGIYFNKQLFFVRPLPISWDKFVKALTEVISSDKGTLELTPQEASCMIKETGIPEDDSQLINETIDPSQIMSLLRPYLETLVRELRMSFDYFRSRFPSEVPSILYMTGRGTEFKNLSVYLSKTVNVEIQELTAPNTIVLGLLKPEKALDRNFKILIKPIGAALGKGKDINLLPGEIKTQKFELMQKLIFQFLGIMILSICLLFVLKNFIQIKDYSARLKNAKVHLATIKELEVLKNKFEVKKDIVGKLQEGKVPVDGLLKIISHIIPNNIIMEKIFLDQSQHILILVGRSIPRERGVETGVTYFMQLLEKTSFVEEASLISTERIDNIQAFEIKCDLAKEDIKNE